MRIFSSHRIVVGKVLDLTSLSYHAGIVLDDVLPVSYRHTGIAFAVSLYHFALQFIVCRCCIHLQAVEQQVAHGG